MCQDTKYYPETVVFVLDACEDPGAEASRHAARFELLKQCIGMFAQAKSRVNANHKYGLAVIRDTVQWEGGAVIASPEGLVAALRSVQPAATATLPLDLGAVVTLVHPLAVAEEADGGRARVILLYCRSTIPPVWKTNRGEADGLCMDVLFVHDKLAAAARAAEAGLTTCPSPQDVYSWLEDNVDDLSTRCGHAAYILEAGGHLAKKVTNHMISLAAHPSQRPHQTALRAVPLDLAAMPPRQPTSATAGASIAGPTAASSPPLAEAAMSYNPLLTYTPHPEFARQSAATAAPAPFSVGYATSPSTSSPPLYRPPGTVLAPPPAIGSMDPAVQALMDMSLSPNAAGVGATAASVSYAGSGMSAGSHGTPLAPPAGAALAAATVANDGSPQPYLSPSSGAEGGRSYSTPSPPSAAAATLELHSATGAFYPREG